MKQKKQSPAHGQNSTAVIPNLPQGPQGSDKAPGEDPPGKPEGDPKQSLTGKKVDADPADPKDEPAKP